MTSLVTKEVSVRIDERAARVLKDMDIVEPKIFVTVESSLYITCCGGYEEKSLRVQVLDKIEDSSNLILVDGGQRIYMQREALDLLESRGNRLAIYADLK